MHAHGEIAARAAIAAQAQGKFWETHDQLFTHGEQLGDADILKYAAAIGLDLDRFRADLQSPATKARLDADRKLGDSLQVKGTPTIFINGREYDSRSTSATGSTGRLPSAPRVSGRRARARVQRREEPKGEGPRAGKRQRARAGGRNAHNEA